MALNTSYARWKDLAERELPDEPQMGPRFDQPRAFLPDNGPINAATMRPPTEPSMKVTEGTGIKWMNVVNILFFCGVIIFLLSLNY
jgi:hypothetical protein